LLQGFVPGSGRRGGKIRHRRVNLVQTSLCVPLAQVLHSVLADIQLWIEHHDRLDAGLRVQVHHLILGVEHAAAGHHRAVQLAGKLERQFVHERGFWPT